MGTCQCFFSILQSTDDSNAPTYTVPTETVKKTEGQIHKEWIAAADNTMNRASLALFQGPIHKE